MPEHKRLQIKKHLSGIILSVLAACISCNPLVLRAADVTDQEITRILDQMQQFLDAGDRGQAIAAGEACVARAAATHGENHLENFRCAFRLAQTCSLLGEYSQAIVQLNTCQEIVKNTTDKALSYGFEHQVVFALANNQHKSGDYANAESGYKRAIEIVEKKFGKESPDLIPSLTSLGLLYVDLQQYSKAKAALNRCLENIRVNKDTYQTESAVLQHLAHVHVKTGDYVQAELFYKRAIERNEKRFGPESPATIIPRASLGELYVRTGEYAKAESACGRALELAEISRDRTHAGLTHSLTCLGDLHQTIGDFVHAEKLYQRALESGGANPEFAFILQRLAQIAYLTDAYPKAIALYEQALGIVEQSLGKEHPHLTPILHDLGLCYWRMGDDVKAISFLERALHVAEKTLGKNSPDVIAPLNSLSRLQTFKGNLNISEPLAKRAIAVAEKIFGKEHHELVDKLYALALIKHARGDSAAAWQQLVRLNTIDGKLVREVFGFTSEKQKMSYLARSRRYINLSLRELTTLASNQLAVRAGFSLWLTRKGVVLESQKQFQHALFHADDPKIAEIFKNLSAVRTELSNLILVNPDQEGQEAYRQKIAQLDMRKERLEGELSALSQTFAAHAQKEKVDIARIAHSLPPKSALVDFARIDAAQTDYDRIAGAHKKEPAARYLAFVLPAGADRQITLVDLGDAAPIEKKLAELKESLGSRIAQPETAQAAQAVNNAAAGLCQLVFTPLRSTLGDAKELFLSPDGALNLLPFEVLRDESGRYLIQEYTFNYIAASRDLLSFGRLKGKPGKNLIMGNPDYNMDDAAKQTVVSQLHLKRAAAGDPYIFSRELRNFRFTSLPGTQQEAEAIRAILGEQSSEFFLGKEALEDVLTSRRAPRILHLATHGFYLSDQPPPSVEIPNSMEIGPPRLASGAEDAEQLIYEDPLVRSGIALAGANVTIAAQNNTQTDGVVTAEKILNLNLLGTDLVVLSACESGLGDVKSGEGVFGLRRAFSQAGAKSLVVSMWSVPDAETKELMEALYKNLQSGSMNRAQALRQAALSEMETVRQRFGNANPFFWGAFIFSGER